MEKEKYSVVIDNTSKYIKENIDIIYEDNHLLVVVKPKNLLSQGDDTKDPNILDILKEYIRVKYNKKGEAYLGLVQRLDRPTAGIMVFAKTSKSASRISEEIRNKKLKKRYLAVTDGVMDGKLKDIKKIENHIIKDSKNNKSIVVDKTDAKDAKKSVMEYRIIEKGEDSTLLDINLITGRSHQIRTSLSNIDHPIVGDVKYAKYFKFGKKTKDLGLFAYYLGFKHPTKDVFLEFVIPPFEYNDVFTNYKDSILELIYY